MIGPYRWGTIKPAYGLCGTGSNQSPIDIKTHAAKKVKLGKIRLAFTYHTTLVLYSGILVWYS